jgi:hypothetical protein
VKYRAVAEEGVPLRDIAEVIGRGLRIPVISVSPEKADDHFGWLAVFRSRPFGLRRAHPGTPCMAPDPAWDDYRCRTNALVRSLNVAGNATDAVVNVMCNRRGKEMTKVWQLVRPSL